MSVSSKPVFLIGFMGSGKSAVGARLAERMGRRFLDTDRLIEQREGRSIEALFGVSGEGYFRRVEWQVVQDLEQELESVIATGGGLFLGWRQRNWLKRKGFTVWLDLPLAVARDRLGEGRGRPLWAPEDPLAVRALFEKRRAAYALAEIRVDAAGAGIDEVARRIQDQLARFFR
jgi:shikimate kinase